MGRDKLKICKDKLKGLPKLLLKQTYMNECPKIMSLHPHYGVKDSLCWCRKLFFNALLLHMLKNVSIFVTSVHT